VGRVGAKEPANERRDGVFESRKKSGLFGSLSNSGVFGSRKRNGMLASLTPSGASGRFGTRKKGNFQTPSAGKLVGVVGLTAVAVYLFDPRTGKSRRSQIKDRVMGTMRRGTKRVGRTAENAVSTAAGKARGAVAAVTPDTAPPNDQALAAKIQSEVLRKATYPAINVNVEDGVAILRGQLDDEETISELEQKVRKISGVHDVRNLVHLPGGAPLGQS
jgi:hypothetical protein